MQQKINIEELLYEEAQKCLPATKLESVFLDKYADAEKVNLLELESDLTDTMAECEKRAFKIGFRLAISLMNGQIETDISKMLA